LGLEDPTREIAAKLLQEKGKIDVVIPRGGERLIDFVLKNTRIPVFLNDKGICHVFVDASANLHDAASIVENAKCQRPGVCNSMETVLVHSDVAEKFLPSLYEKLSRYPVKWNGCEETVRILEGRSDVKPVTKDSYDTEYLRLEMNCRVVSSVLEAIEHIRAHGSRHSEAILTENAENATRFQKEVDAAAVYWNASTRFTDGGEFGLGAEIGISTQKLHARGPIGVRELMSLRYWIKGEGTVRK
jgi:glutamate-5-semialdehyde dehydrogenase